MKKFTDFIIKYRILILLILIFIVLPAILIPTTYINKYNKHAIFDQEKLELSNPQDNGFLTFDMYAKSYKDATLSASDNKTITNGEIKLSSTIKATNKTLKNIKVTYLITTFWDSEWENNQSETTVSFPTTLTANQKAVTKSSTLSIKRLYPYKPILFVKVETPTIYVKVTFETDKTQILDHEQETKLNTLYFKYEYNQYVNDKTEILK